VEEDPKKARRREQYARHRERERAYQREYYAANRDRLQAASRARHEANRDAVRDYQRSWVRMDRLRRPILYLLVSAKARAAKRGLPFDLSPADLQIPEFCPVLGIPITVATGPVRDGSPSLDRIDNNGGYVVGNVRIISFRANFLKGSMSQSEARLIADLGWPE
jgi:hypothetical protein